MAKKRLLFSAGGFRFDSHFLRFCPSTDFSSAYRYIAASSGPKNVILVLDTSGSMDKLRLKFMKEAAKRVVETLTFSDRVAIVSFATRAKVFAREGKYVYQANKANKKILTDAIDSFEAIGATNFLDAFEKTFEILNHVFC